MHPHDDNDYNPSRGAEAEEPELSWGWGGNLWTLRIWGGWNQRALEGLVSPNLHPPPPGPESTFSPFKVQFQDFSFIKPLMACSGFPPPKSEPFQVVQKLETYKGWPMTLPVLLLPMCVCMHTIVTRTHVTYIHIYTYNKQTKQTSPASPERQKIQGWSKPNSLSL